MGGVGTLGEMDPIDDRIMQKTESHGGLLLGYNTNRGLRIDIKLRTDDLSEFRPYSELVQTLIHELSHNWVGDHNLLFWTNYAQMRTEYLYTHKNLRRPYNELAGLNASQLDDVFGTIMKELSYDMRQRGLHPNMIIDPIKERIRQLEKDDKMMMEKKEKKQQEKEGGHRLGGNNTIAIQQSSSSLPSSLKTTRELALAAAERRANEYQKQQQQQKGDNRNNN